ncbi:MAG: hypothetical protein OEY86_20415 [Nitrospira sp.]|nr:hypothetical protein [Nitrospira sp.]
MTWVKFGASKPKLSIDASNQAVSTIDTVAKRMEGELLRMAEAMRETRNKHEDEIRELRVKQDEARSAAAKQEEAMARLRTAGIEKDREHDNQIRELKDALKERDTEITSMKEADKDLKAELTKIRQDYSALKRKYETVVEENKKLKKRVEQLENPIEDEKAA